MAIQNNRRNALFPIIIFFIILNGLFIAARSFLLHHNFDTSVLIAGNLVIFAATIFSFLFANRGLRAENPHAFVRSVYASIMIKLLICLVAALLYILLSGKELNKPALFACMGFYLIYTFIEVSVLTKLLKEKKNA